MLMTVTLLRVTTLTGWPHLRVLLVLSAPLHLGLLICLLLLGLMLQPRHGCRSGEAAGALLLGASTLAALLLQDAAALAPFSACNSKKGHLSIQ